ncbi:hypothetical protein [Paraburkholderia sp. BL17N1]|uniref:hypothetical protein n=1 Tax=Paraburkholderia sp. BL17N1 TaxID=1938798 RepID=UPI000EB528BF|nr:hypothetical protein [Paraburkholderia sp. BL17N1]RKR45957.1 hypothetical protein B0G82_3625 [Paraburkholderia sp. BL17N1]
MSLLSFLLAGSENEEVHATRSLTYLLGRNGAFRAALLSAWARDTHSPEAATESLTFKAEVQADQGRCDIAGVDSTGRLRVLVEGKFWASLTDHQPGGYLNAFRALPSEEDLHGGQGGLLVFVAPFARFETLWPELLRRVEASGYALEGAPSQLPQMRSARLRRTGAGHASEGADGRSALAARPVLALTSWGAVLNTLEDEGIKSEDRDFVSDVRQLAALCQRMDTTAFLPLKASELTSAIGRRAFQFQNLFADLRERLLNTGVATKYVGSNRSAEWLPLLLNGERAYLRFWLEGWAEHRETPLWLAFPKTGELPLLAADQIDRLQALERERPPRLIDDAEYRMVPLYPKLHAERLDVLDDLIAQVRAVAQLIARTSAPAPSDRQLARPT